MLPTFPATSDVLSGEIPAFEGSFTPWDLQDIFQPFQSPKPVISSCCSEELNPKQAGSNSGSENPNPAENSSFIDERKRRRMISNRESARRSRMRKQKHLENLRNRANQLRVENRVLGNRLRVILYHCQCVQAENERLRSEHSGLRQRLSEIRRVLLLRQMQQQLPSPTSFSSWPCNTGTATPVISEITQSLITY